MGVDPEVKIFQKWDGHRPDYRLLIGSFHADLIEQQQRQRARTDLSNNRPSNSDAPKTIPWIEKLLQTPIGDYRKHGANLIIIPYLVVCRGMTDRNEIHDMYHADGPINAQNLEGLTLRDVSSLLGLGVG